MFMLSVLQRKQLGLGGELSQLRPLVRFISGKLLASFACHLCPQQHVYRFAKHFNIPWRQAFYMAILSPLLHAYVLLRTHGCYTCVDTHGERWFCLPLRKRQGWVKKRGGGKLELQWLFSDFHKKQAKVIPFRRRIKDISALGSQKTFHCPVGEMKKGNSLKWLFTWHA